MAGFEGGRLSGMAGRAEYLYSQLQAASAVLKLIGEAEDPHLDCKEWPMKDEGICFRRH